MQAQQFFTPAMQGWAWWLAYSGFWDANGKGDKWLCSPQCYIRGWKWWSVFKSPTNPTYSPPIQTQQIKGAGFQCNNLFLRLWVLNPHKHEEIQPHLSLAPPSKPALLCPLTTLKPTFADTLTPLKHFTKLSHPGLSSLFQHLPVCQPGPPLPHSPKAPCSRLEVRF